MEKQIKKKISARQDKWAMYFAEKGNAAEAARLAGYSEKYANRTGSANMMKSHIMERVQEYLKKIEDASIAKAEEVMQYLTKVLRGEEEEEVVVVENVGDYMSEARKLKKEVQPKDKLKAAELLAKRYGLLTDKMDLMADMDLHVVVDYGDDSSEV